MCRSLEVSTVLLAMDTSHTKLPAIYQNTITPLFFVSQERGYKLRGLSAFPTIPHQLARYRDLGYSGGVSVYDMNDIYYKVLPLEEVSRIERIEIFDDPSSML